MNKKQLLDIITSELSKIGFKKKGDYWLNNGAVITKMVNLQKSQYANNYYINFGYIIEGISLEGLKMHVYNRITSSSAVERERIGRLLDLASEVSDDERETSLKDVLHEKLITKMKVINSKEDLSNELKSRSQTNDIPLSVKKYLNLQIE